MEHEVNQMSKKGGWQEQGKASHSSFWIRQEAYVEGHHEKVGKRAVLAHGLRGVKVPSSTGHVTATSASEESCGKWKKSQFGDCFSSTRCLS